VLNSNLNVHIRCTLKHNLNHSFIYLNFYCEHDFSFTYCQSFSSPSVSPNCSVSRMFGCMGQSLHAGAHIFPSSFFFINHNLYVGSGVLPFQGLCCAYSTVINEGELELNSAGPLGIELETTVLENAHQSQRFSFHHPYDLRFALQHRKDTVYVPMSLGRPAAAAGAGGVVKSESLQVRQRAFVPPPSPCSLGNTHSLESHGTISFSLLQRAGQHSLTPNP